MIEWFSKKDKVGFATIYPTNITINKNASSEIESSYACMLGIDKEEKHIYVKPISKDDYDAKRYNEESTFILSGAKSYTRVSSTDFVNMISRIFDVDFKKQPKKYEAEFNKRDEVLIINLRKEVLWWLSNKHLFFYGLSCLPHH